MSIPWPACFGHSPSLPLAPLFTFFLSLSHLCPALSLSFALMKAQKVRTLPVPCRDPTSDLAQDLALLTEDGMAQGKSHASNQ